jgi:hypothetical protein
MECASSTEPRAINRFMAMRATRSIRSVATEGLTELSIVYTQNPVLATMDS